jgi:hypothetical protein
MSRGAFTPARPSRLALGILCVVAALAACSPPRAGRSDESRAVPLTIVSQHHFYGALVPGG